MKNYIIKIGLWLVAMLTVLPASAYDFEVDGIYYTITSFTDFTCEVTRGDVKYEGDVVIPSEITYNSRNLTVTSIERKAFYDCSSLTSVTIPKSVTSIGEYAFYDCSSLTSVTIPKSVTSIGEYAFEDCCSLISITIPYSVRSIEKGTFRGCSSLTSVTISNSVNYIRDYAFSGCSSLTLVDIPISVISIGESAFKGCNSLVSVNISGSVLSSIGRSAFSGCSSLTSIIIPDSVETIGSYAFSGCSSLTSIIIPDSVEDIGEYTFSDCSSLTSIALSSNLSSLSYGLFRNCSALESIEIPESVKKVILCLYSMKYDNYEHFTFFNCTNLSKLSLVYSSSPLTIGSFYYYGYSPGHDIYYWGSYDASFNDRIKELYINRRLSDYISFPNLEKLELGENLENVQIRNISNLEKITTIYSYALTPPELSTMSNKQYMDMMVYVPEEAIDAYRNAPSWKNFWNLAPINGITDIENDLDSDAPVHIYTINGTEMKDKDSLPAGIYIMRQGSKTKKIVVGR